MRPDVLVVLPTYNESANLEAIVVAIRAQGASVLVVDDGSPDGTGELADVIAAADDGVEVLHRTTKEGLGPAYAAGFARALTVGAEVICEMDADFSHDPAALPALVSAIDAGAGLAIGSRYVPGGATEGWPFHRRWLSRGGNVYARALLGSSVRDMTAGFRAFRADVLAGLQPDRCEASGYGFQIEMAWRAGIAGVTITEVPITFRERVAGSSKMDFRIALEAIRLVTRWGWGRMRGRLPWRPEEAR